MSESPVLSNLAHISEIITYTLNGIVSFLLYWPFIWLFFNPKYISENFEVLGIFVNSYTLFIKMSSSWLSFPIIIFALPCIGMLNKAFLSLFFNTVSKIYNNRFFSKIIKTLKVYHNDNSKSDEILSKVDKYFNPN